MTHDEMIAVIQAAKDGKTIQFRTIYTGFNTMTGSNRKNIWADHTKPCFNFADFEYRVKPEPVTLWINEYKDAFGHISYGTRHYNEEDAHSLICIGYVRTVKFVEELD